MSVLKGIKEDGQEVTAVQPDSETEKTVKELQERGYKNIHNAETGEVYQDNK